MEWGVVSVVGFAAATAVVVWLARSNTARSERRARAARERAARREAVVRRRQAEVLVSVWRTPSRPGRGRLRRAAALVRVRLPRAGRPRGRPRRVGVPHVGLPHLHLPHVHLPERVVARMRHRAGDRAGSGPEDRPDDRSGSGPEDASPPLR
ncbi:hypothetical protein [Blastococcus sp. SYSU D00813]